ncbi:MAG: hypothetical protein IKJ58_02260 [Akkermansia sp.]|nr:hypothetical protein [Akkermansia sp.]
MVKSSGSNIEVLYLDEARRVSGAATRLLAAANEGNKCAMLVEAHALLGQVRSLAESLEYNVNRRVTNYDRQV